jgi:hypothetical protein
MVPFTGRSGSNLGAMPSGLLFRRPTVDLYVRLPGALNVRPVQERGEGLQLTRGATE